MAISTAIPYAQHDSERMASRATGIEMEITEKYRQYVRNCYDESPRAVFFGDCNG